MIFLTAFGHEGCYSQSSVNLARDMSSLGLRLASTMAPQSLTDSVETVHTQLGVSLWLLMGWLKAVTVINGLEQNMLVFIYCVENFVNISVQIINTVSEYAGVLSRLFSTMADRAC